MNELADVRRANLKAIIERDGLASASRRFQKPDRQLNDMAAGRKSFGEKVARAMERNYDAARIPGWLDLPPSDGPGHPTPALPAPSTETAGPALSAALADLLESARPLQDADVKLLTQLARRMNRSASLESTEIYGPAPQADVGRVAAFAEKLTKGS